TCIAATGACSNPPRDGPCDDGNKCTRTDMCQNGSCQGGDPVVCTPLDDCHDAGVCNPATGVCTNPVKPRCPCTRDDECDDANPCDDGNSCTGDGTCHDGTCTPGAALGCFVGVRCACNPGLGCGAEVVPSKVNDPFSRACGLVTTAKEITANLTIGKAQRLRM